MDAWNYKPLKLRFFQSCGEEDQRCPPHQVLRITLKNGEIYIIDLAGAQYGHYESVVPVDTYFQTRAGSVLERRIFGHQQRLLKQACGAPTWRGAILDCNEQFHRGLNLSIDVWQKENVSLDSMLNLAEKHFLQRQRHLIAFVDEKLREYKEWAEIGGLFKICKVADVEASHWIET